MSRDRGHTEERVLAEAAAARLEHRAGSTRAWGKALYQWLCRAPLHVRELFFADALDHAIIATLRHEEPFRTLDREALRAQLLTAADQVIFLSGTHQVSTAAAPSQAALTSALRRRPLAAFITLDRRRWPIAAALAGISVGVLLSHALLRASSSVESDAGEWRTVTLSDSSTMRLGPRTRIEVTFDDTRRTVRLIAGEALFDVVKDAARPFCVKTHLAIACAVGTTFSVSHASQDAIEVTVDQGIVTVAQPSPIISVRASTQPPGSHPVTLNAGEQVVVIGGTVLTGSAVKAVDVTTELAWAEGWLMFENTTLAQAIAQFNRRNRVQIELHDLQIADRAVWGRYRATDPQTFASAIAVMAGDAVVVSDDTLSIVPSGTDRMAIRDET